MAIVDVFKAKGGWVWRVKPKRGNSGPVSGKVHKSPGLAIKNVMAFQDSVMKKPLNIRIIPDADGTPQAVAKQGVKKRAPKTARATKGK
jgi:hypothetical protein